jgi:demethylmenaquinone methyltransferase/2-methoxy-6-polyprenyl-1,4-benzoquinol methylase
MSEPLAGGIEEYYARRASEYDRIYARPERQADLAELRAVLSRFALGRRLLEVACGTGYWTLVAAPVAESVVATDAVDEVLGVARGRGMPEERVRFVRADAFELQAVPGDFDAGFAGFWWSHVRRGVLPGFLEGLHRRLGPGAAMLFFDNRFVEGSSTPIARTDAAGDTCQERVLSDGSRYEVVKNFPSRSEVRQWLADAGGKAIRVEELDYYWCATYEVGETQNR